jgi:hypothetical protein
MPRSKKTIHKNKTKKTIILISIIILCIILWCYKMHGNTSDELQSIININNTELTILSPNITW